MRGSVGRAGGSVPIREGLRQFPEGAHSGAVAITKMSRCEWRE